MNKTIPGYLRLHQAPPSAGNDVRPEAITVGRENKIASTIDNFWNAYTAATGWRIDPKQRRSSGIIQLLPAVTIDAMCMPEDLEDMPMTSESEARRLAELAMMLTEDLKKSRRVLRRQAAELAARAALISSQPKQEDLAQSIERILADATLACGCNSAALYLLDEDTSSLSLRFSHGMPESRIEDEPRALRGSRGDLEALVQGVVTIDDLKAGSIDTWSCPEESAEAAICAALNVDDLPIGTVWLFSDNKQEFDAATSAAARLTATHVARELSSVSSTPFALLERQTKSWVRDLAAWQHRTLPVGTCLAEDWGVDGMLESPSDWAVGWHTWDILPDGTILVAMAEALDPSITGAMVASVARTALTAHAGYRHTPKQLLQRISDTLWQTNTGDQIVSVLCAHIQPETGEGEIASSGQLSAMIGNRYGYRPLTTGNSDPLGLNVDPQSVINTFNMTRGDSLLAYGPGWTADGATQHSIGAALKDGMSEANLNPLASLRRDHAKLSLNAERGAMAILRATM